MKNISVSVTSRAGTLTRQRALHIQGKKAASGARSVVSQAQEEVWPERPRVQDHRDPAERGRTSGYSEGKCARQSSDTT